MTDIRKIIILVLIYSFFATFSMANDFLDGIDDFENGRFREAGLKLLPLASQGDLYAQTYINWIKEKDATLIPEGAPSFPVLISCSFLEPLRDALEASIVKLRYTGLASSVGIPLNKKKGAKDLGVLLTRSNPRTLIVMNDLMVMREDVPVPKKAKISLGSYYGEAVNAGDYFGALKLRKLNVPSKTADEILGVVNGLGVSASQGAIYFSLYNHFKVSLGYHDISRNFCRMAAYHGHSEAQFNLLSGFITSEEEGDFWVEQAAQHGHKRAMGRLAYNHEQNGELKEAFELYLKLGQEEDADPIILFNLGAFYEDGRGGSLDRAKALEYYKRAYRKTSPAEEYKITDPHIFHAIVYLLSKTENSEALAWLKAGVAQRDIPSMREYGISLYKGTFEPRDLQKALTYLRLAGLENDLYYSESMIVLSGLLIEHNLRGSKAEWDDVERFLLKRLPPPKPAIIAKSKSSASVKQPAASSESKSVVIETQGLPILTLDADGASYMLSLLYEKGKGGTEKPSPEKASFYLEQAMNLKCPAAFLRKGQFYEAGPEKNDAMAFECYLKADELGLSLVANHLGVYCMNGGDNVHQDDIRAISYFKRAMELDQDGSLYNGIAHHNYAIMLQNNRGGLVYDEAQWISILEKAVYLGDKTALRSLGLHYLRNDDLARASQCFSEAAAAGDKKSSYNLALLEIQTLPINEERLKPLADFENLVKGDFDPDTLFSTGLIFILNQDLHEDFREKGKRYLEEAIKNGSEEARCLLNLLRNEKALREYEDFLRKRSEDLASGNQATAEGQILEEMLSTIPDEFMEDEASRNEEEELQVEDEDSVTMDYQSYAAPSQERMKRYMGTHLDEKNLKTKRLSRKAQAVLDLLDPKSTKQVSPHKIFSIISDLIKEKGGSMKRSKKGVRIAIGDQKLFMHLHHGKKHESKVDGGRLESLRTLIQNVSMIQEGSDGSYGE